MTLKAKVEAIVYAAEEPVTLAQLSGIFSSEVLDGLAAAETQSQQQVAEESPGAEAKTLWENEEFEAQMPDAPEAEPQEPQSQEASGEPETETVQGPESPLGAALDAAPGEAPAEAAAKKAARARERRVREVLQAVLDELIADYSKGQRGMEIREIAGGYRMATKPEYHDAVRGFVKSLKPPMKLSLQALETLAVIAYKQPVTAPEVSEVRGVDSGGVMGSLVARKLITTAGRKHVIGRPILYKTTREFLLRFGLKDVNELPSVEEFEKMAGELADAEAEVEDAAMRSSDLPLGNGEIETIVAEEEDLSSQDTAREVSPESAATDDPSTGLASDNPVSEAEKEEIQH